ncbi:MAG: glycosyltransferase family 2 protein [Planctomycetes bacterium]|nr:glycosyltransferase family 2 protein [Planctomycetota bacterium]
MKWRHLRKRLKAPLIRRRLRSQVAEGATRADLAGRTASVVLVTWNRLPFLQLALASLLRTTRFPDWELIVWDNASTDGTREWLAAVDDPRVRVVAHGENIGLNAYRRAMELARGEFLVHTDDDVIAHPEGWLESLALAFLRLPVLGYLGTDVVQDAWTHGAKPSAFRYVDVPIGEGLTVQVGPVGGWCTMTTREVYERVGGFHEEPGQTYFFVDASYYARCRKAGLQKGILKGVRVYHACGVDRRDPAGREAFFRHFDAGRGVSLHAL